MSADAELMQWRLSWHAQAGHAQPVQLDVARLRMQVARDTRRRRMGLVPQLLVTLVLGAGSLWHAWAVSTPMASVYAVSIWVCLVTAWLGTLVIARGTWRPHEESTAAFIQVTLRRHRSTLRSVPFAIALYIVELMFFVWLPVHMTGGDLREAMTRWPVVVLGWIGLPVFIAAMIWWRRRTLRQLRYWAALQQQLLAS